MTLTEQAQEQWQLSGDGSESYERFQVPSIFEPLARVFLNNVPLRPGDLVLDVACGTGIVARLAATVVGPEGHVAGVDLNPGMLTVAKRRAAEVGAAIQYREGDAGALPYIEGSFDAVLCQQGLQFFPDKEGALREMHRVLAPGGILALCVWRSIEHSPCNKALVDALSPHLGIEDALRLYAPFALGEVKALQTLIEAAGFHEPEIRIEVIVRQMLPPQESIPGHLASTPIGPQFAALDTAARAAVIEDATAALQRFHTTCGMAVPQGTHIVVARK